MTDTKLKNLVATMLNEASGYEHSISEKTYAASDIPTRAMVDRYLPRLKRAFGEQFAKAQN